MAKLAPSLSVKSLVNLMEMLVGNVSIYLGSANISVS